MTETKEYKDQFTLDGRLTPAHPTVTRAKVKEADRLLTSALRGNAMAAGALKEVHTTSDLPFALAHLISTVAIPQFDVAPRTWEKIAGVRVVPDFDSVRLHSLIDNLPSGAGVIDGTGDTNRTDGLPTVPEGAPYPYLTIGKGREAFSAKIAKRGAKFGFTWESNVNDIEGFYDSLPSDLVQLALDTEEREVYEALLSSTKELVGGTLPDGTVISVNAPVSVNAIGWAIHELQLRTINGRLVGPSSTGYNVVVPVGTKWLLDYQLSQKLLQVQNGSLTFDGGDRSWLGAFDIVESAYVTGTKWYVLPKPGGLRRPILELGRLRGYESPELRANGNTGVYLGSSAVVPFNQGSWDADTIDYRIRMVCGGILWDDDLVMYSKGDGNA